MMACAQRDESPSSRANVEAEPIATDGNITTAQAEPPLIAQPAAEAKTTAAEVAADDDAVALDDIAIFSDAIPANGIVGAIGTEAPASQLPFIGDHQRAYALLVKESIERCSRGECSSLAGEPIFQTISVDVPGALRQGRALMLLAGRYFYTIEEKCVDVEIPPGFVTDFASIPALLRVKFIPHNYAAAALIHDWLYAIGVSGDETTRKAADGVFLQALIDMGYPEAHARELYRGVRLGGKKGYGLDSDFAFYLNNQSGVIRADRASQRPAALANGEARVGYVEAMAGDAWINYKAPQILGCDMTAEREPSSR